MIRIREFTISRWRPDSSSSGVALGTWWAVRFDGYELTNTAAEVDWESCPTQLIICESCGTIGCANGGYGKISRLGRDILLTAPEIDPTKDLEALQFRPLPAIEESGGLVVSREVWDDLRNRLPAVPDSGAFPKATYREISQAWLMSAPSHRRALSLGDLKCAMSDDLLAADNLSRQEALAELEAVVAWLERSADQVVRERIADVSDDLRIERFYFDGPVEQDWYALAQVAGQTMPAFSADLFLCPSYGTD